MACPWQASQLVLGDSILSSRLCCSSLAALYRLGAIHPCCHLALILPAVLGPRHGCSLGPLLLLLLLGLLAKVVPGQLLVELLLNDACLVVHQVALDRHALPVDQPLVPVPGDLLPGTSKLLQRQVVPQERKDVAHVLALDINLGEHGEGHVVSLLCKLLDHCLRPGLLLLELVAGECKHHKAVGTIALVCGLESFVVHVCVFAV
mmetsp:Transcript_10131/g.25268  ORF Transcript_10131/g.25268 Transcript_10131/m.25268 type:complete len:205 (-) Transcript_10131:336-950(-)